MKQLMAVLIFLAASVCAYAGEEATYLILSLQEKSDNEVTSRLDVYANYLDPNTSHSNDAYRIELNGAEISVPLSIIYELDYNRRSHSYDSQSGGIEAFVSGGYCRMGGPAMGLVYYSRYLTYEKHTIVNYKLRPIFSENLNCLFSEGYSPVKPHALASAIKNMATMNTIKAYATAQALADK